MVYRTLRKRRSKRSMKRSIKHYRRHANTRIRRNIYRKKHKKTQRGGVLEENYTSGVPLPEKWRLLVYQDKSNNRKLPIYVDPENFLHFDHPNLLANNSQVNLILKNYYNFMGEEHPSIDQLNLYDREYLEKLRNKLTEINHTCVIYLKAINERIIKLTPPDNLSNLLAFGSTFL